MVFEVNSKLFGKKVRKVIAVSIQRASPWYEFVRGADGMIKKRECRIVIDDVHMRAVNVCRDVDKAKEFLLLPILVIEAGHGVLTVVTAD